GDAPRNRRRPMPQMGERQRRTLEPRAPRNSARAHSLPHLLQHQYGPRVHDIELKHIVDIVLGVRAGAYSFEAGNPRHEHEWRVWENIKLPDGKLLIPGVVTHASNLVEHPETIAQRIGCFASVVRRENVIAGADCGFASFSTSCEVHPSVVWAKL